MQYHAQDRPPSSDPVTCGQVAPSVILLIALQQLSTNPAITPLLQRYVVNVPELLRASDRGGETIEHQHL
jgi:hypothetical protein